MFALKLAGKISLISDKAFVGSFWYVCHLGFPLSEI